MFKKNIFLAFIILTIFNISNFGEVKRLTIITEEWPPFNYTENGVIKGFSMEIINYLMKELKVNYQVQIFSTARIMDILKKERNVMFFTMLRIPERETQFKWIGPIGEDAIYFYKKRENPLKIKSLEEAKKVKSIACRHIGLVYSTLIKAGFTNLDTTSNSVGIYMKVVSGRCELGIGETPLGVKYWLKKQNISSDTLEQIPIKVIDSQLYIVCSKDVSDKEISLWQNALDKMKSSGDYKRLYQKYYQ
jgi:polar amino acid transport system substrate-binding protein